MGYVYQNLMDDEDIKYTTKLHWIVYLQAIIWFLVFIISLLFIMFSSDDSRVFFIILIITSTIGFVASFIKAWITKFSTELAITTKRVIAKTGFIRRNTIELNHSKVESFAVDQSILGRILGFGTLTINGTGGIKTPITNVDDPLEFRKQAIRIIDSQ